MDLYKELLEDHQYTDEEKQEAQKHMNILKKFSMTLENIDLYVWLKVIKREDGFHYYIIGHDGKYQFNVIDYNEEYKTKYNNYIFTEGLLACIIKELEKYGVVKSNESIYFDKYKGHLVRVTLNEVYSRYRLQYVFNGKYILPDYYYKITCQNSDCKDVFYYLESEIHGNGSIICQKCGWINT